MSNLLISCLCIPYIQESDADTEAPRKGTLPIQSSDELSSLSTYSTTEGESSHTCSSTTAQQGSSSTDHIVIDDDEMMQHNISLKLTAAGILHV